MSTFRALAAPAFIHVDPEPTFVAKSTIIKKSYINLRNRSESAALWRL